MGIVSSQPGITLGLDYDDPVTENTYPIALSGRVPVKISLLGGPIKTGDRITISPTPGIGMKAGVFDPSVGIALEDYVAASTTSATSTVDLITVFVDLDSGMKLTDIVDGLFGTSTGVAQNTGNQTQFVDALFDAMTVEILSASSTTTSSPVFNFIDALYAAILDKLTAMGIFVTETMTRIANLFVDELTVGSASLPSGVTLYDETNGAPYCIKMVAGVLQSISGTCDNRAGSPSLPSQAPAPAPTPAPSPEPSPTPAIDIPAVEVESTMPTEETVEPPLEIIEDAAPTPPTPTEDVGTEPELTTP
jgi:hypothetical protein